MKAQVPRSRQATNWRIALVKNLQAIRGRYADDVPLTGLDRILLNIVLEAHPHAAEKIGPGVAEIVIRTDTKARIRNFYVVRTDGTVELFSAIKVARSAPTLGGRS